MPDHIFINSKNCPLKSECKIPDENFRVSVWVISEVRVRFTFFLSSRGVKLLSACILHHKQYWGQFKVEGTLQVDCITRSLVHTLLHSYRDAFIAARIILHFIKNHHCLSFPVQNNLERSEFEARTRLGAQVETLQREVNLLKKKLESEEKHHKSIVDTWEVRK